MSAACPSAPLCLALKPCIQCTWQVAPSVLIPEPPCVRPAAETSYLSPASGEPVLYINIEDHVSYAIRRTNDDFQAIMQILRSPVCGGRLHWWVCSGPACSRRGGILPCCCHNKMVVYSALPANCPRQQGKARLIC